MDRMLSRIIGAARQDPVAYEEIRHDPSATKQAAIIVVVVALATGVSSISLGRAALVFGIFGLFEWALWSYVIYKLGTTLFKTPATDASWPQLMRTTGFAHAPGLLRIFTLIPPIAPFFLIISIAWQFTAMFEAARQTLGYTSKFRAMGVVILSFFPAAAVYYLFFTRLLQPG